MTFMNITKKILGAVCVIAFFIGFIIVLGTAGAEDAHLLNVGEFIKQGACGFACMFGAVLVGFFIKGEEE